MKQIFIGDEGAAAFDTESQQMYSIDRVPDRITNLFVINEPTKVIVKNFNGEQYTLDAEAGDLVVSFYSNDYEKRTVLIKCADWYNNIVKYNELEAKRKEEWANAHSEKCEACDACVGDIPSSC